MSRIWQVAFTVAICAMAGAASAQDDPQSKPVKPIVWTEAMNRFLISQLQQGTYPYHIWNDLVVSEEAYERQFQRLRDEERILTAEDDKHKVKYVRREAEGSLTTYFFSIENKHTGETIEHGVEDRDAWCRIVHLVLHDPYLYIFIQVDNNRVCSRILVVDLNTREHVRSYMMLDNGLSPDGRYLALFVQNPTGENDCVLAIKDLAGGINPPEEGGPSAKSQVRCGKAVYPPYALETGKHSFQRGHEYTFDGPYIWAPDGLAVAFRATQYVPAIRGNVESYNNREEIGSYLAIIRFSPGVKDVQIEHVEVGENATFRPAESSSAPIVGKRGNIGVWGDDHVVRFYSNRSEKGLRVTEIPVPEHMR